MTIAPLVLAAAVAAAPGPIGLAWQQPPVGQVGPVGPVSKVKPSQRGSVTQRLADTTITVDYSRPVARGRELFGVLVPYGRIWCPGADDATTIEVSAPVTIGGQELPAGKYSIWAEPRRDAWTIIFSRSHAVWHTRYPEGQDALRIEATPRSGSHMETLAFYFPVVEGRTAELVLHWGTTVVPISVASR